MIVIDTNLLIYASIRELPQYEASHRWLDDQLNELPRVGLPWSSLLSFVRLVTNPRIFPKALSVAAAWQHVARWLSWPAVWIPMPTRRHPEVLGSLLCLPGMNTDLVQDAHLAALAIEHDLTLCTSDGDFSKFPGLRWQNPI